MNETKSLPALVQDSLAILSEAIENEGELPPSLDFQDQLSEAALALKADQYGFVDMQIEAQKAVVSERMDALLAFGKSLEKAQENLKNRMMNALIALGRKELAGEETRYVLVQNNQKCVILDEALIPKSYLAPPLPAPPQALDKKKILEDLKVGKEIPGARMERGTRVDRKLNKSIRKVSGK